MPVRAGRAFHSRRLTPQEFAAEFRAQALGIQVERLSSDLVRLRAAIRDHMARPEGHTLARLRYLLGQGEDVARRYVA